MLGRITFRKKQLLFVVTILNLFFSFYCGLLADAWTQKKGSFQMINSLYGEKFSDISIIEGSNTSLLSSNKYSLYMEYGLFNKTTIGLIGIYQNLSSEQNLGSVVNNQDFLGEIFIRQGIIQSPRHALALKLGTIRSNVFNDMFTGYNNSNLSTFDTSAVYSMQYGFEYGFGAITDPSMMKLSGGSDFFVSLAMYFRNNEILNITEVMQNITLGYHFSPEYMGLMFFSKRGLLDVEAFNAISGFSDFGDFALNTINPSESVGLAKFNLSVVHYLSYNNAIELGIYRSLDSNFFTESNMDFNIFGFFISFWLNADGRQRNSGII